MSFEIRTFVKNDDGTVHRFFRWDGMDLTGFQDFVKLWCLSPTATCDVTWTDPTNGSPPVTDPPVGQGIVWLYDPTWDDYSAVQVSPGDWVEIMTAEQGTGFVTDSTLVGKYTELRGA